MIENLTHEKCYLYLKYRTAENFLLLCG